MNLFYAILAGFIAGLPYALSLPGSGSLLCVLCGFAMAFYLILIAASPRVAVLVAFLFSCTLHLTALYWLFEAILLFGFAGRLVGGVLVTAFLLGLSTPLPLVALAIHMLPQRLRARGVLYAGGPLTVVLYLQVHQSIFAFPWLAFGEWLLDTPLRFWIAVVGAHGAGALVLACAAAVAVTFWSVRRGTEDRRRWLVVYGVALVIGNIAIYFWIQRPKIPESSALNAVKITSISLNYSRHDRRTPDAVQRLSSYARHSRTSNAELLVWPESSADESIAAFAPVLRERLGITNATGPDVFLGAREPHRDGKFNVLYNLRDGAIVYRKRRLVPFTEYVPGTLFRWLLDTFQLTIKNNDILAGPESVRSFQWRGRRVYPLLCYEIAYPDFLRHPARATVNGESTPAFILNAGNESWFATGAVRNGTLRQARARALESGLPVVRTVTGGYSGWIDADGRDRVAHEAGADFTRVTGRIAPRPPGGTFFARQGGFAWFILLSLFLVPAMLSEGVRKRTIHVKLRKH